MENNLRRFSLYYIANFKAFGWTFLLSTNLLFLKCAGLSSTITWIIQGKICQLGNRLNVGIEFVKLNNRHQTFEFDNHFDVFLMIRNIWPILNLWAESSLNGMTDLKYQYYLTLKIWSEQRKTFVTIHMGLTVE